MNDREHRSEGAAAQADQAAPDAAPPQGALAQLLNNPRTRAAAMRRVRARRAQGGGSASAGTAGAAGAAGAPDAPDGAPGGDAAAAHDPAAAAHAAAAAPEHADAAAQAGAESEHGGGGDAAGPAPAGPVLRAAAGPSPLAAARQVQRKAVGGGDDPVAAARASLSGLGDDAAGDAPASGGEPLAASVQQQVAAATGADVSAARVHAGPESQRAAAALQARAFTVGSHIHVGAGESPHDAHLMAHEAAHTLQQQEGAPATQLKAVSSPGDALEHEADRVADAATGGGRASISVGAASGVVHRDAVGDVRDLLSYGLFTWSISPSDATQALGQLSAMAWGQLQAAMVQLEDKYQQRLWAALPDSAKADPGYTKVLCALGATRIAPHAAELQAWAKLGWAEADPLAVDVGKVLAALPAAARIAVAAKAGTNLERRIFDATPDAESDTLAKLLGQRFKIDVGPDDDNGQAWSAAGLRRAWTVLAALPAIHLGGSNPSLGKLVRQATNAADTGSGYYEESSKKASVGYNDGKLNAQNKAAQPGDPLYNVNRFDKVVRHEVGHAVDAQTGANKKYCVGNPDGGDWKEHGDGTGLAAIMVAASNGTIAHWKNGPQKAAMVASLQANITNASGATVDSDLQALPFWAKLGKKQQDKILKDRVLDAIRQALDTPWYRHPDGVPLQKRIYMQSYAGQWNSYAVEARARKVSLYQFRAPGEWFAEAYATYYEPNPAGNGALLQPRDPKTKDWFDKNIDGKIAKV